MAVSITWATKVVYVPQADLTPLGGGVYEMDLDWFRGQLNALQAGDAGIVELTTHRHNTQLVVGGTTLARSIEMINGYTVEFEDGQYAVNLVGANSNVSDVLVVNQVSVRSFNTAGLVVSGSGVTQGDKEDIAALVLDEGLTAHLLAGTLGEAMSALRSLQVMATAVVAAGSTTTSVRTTLAQADGYWDGHDVTIVMAGGPVARRIDGYLQTNGEIVPVGALPAAPSPGDQVLVRGAHSAGFGGAV